MSKNKIKVTLPLKPESSKYTDGQWQAIYDGGDNLLVSASAGSGKTTVLVQRVIEKIKAGVNVDELLIVTYTEAAAKEMKERIQVAVQQSVNEESNTDLKRHFLHQLSLIPTAHVSTLHAFCLQVIRRYYYLIHIDPVFRLLTEETEMLLLKEDVWEELRETLYEEEQLAFYKLTENFSNDRNDDGLTGLIFSLYDFARSNPNPKEWLNSLSEAYEVGESLGESKIFQEFLKPTTCRKLVAAIETNQQAANLITGEERFDKVLAVLLTEQNYLKEVLSFFETNQLEACYRYLQTLSFARFPSPRNMEEAEKEANEEVKTSRAQGKDLLTAINKELFSIPPEEMLVIMKQAGEMVALMGQVATKFDDAYTTRKEERNLVDFNDLEHYTLKILANYENAEWSPTEASLYYREKFSEILVDEYQDINQLQETILSWLRQPNPTEGNFFMVGDVKQSIYSFRLADPSLFIEKYNLFAKEEEGRRIILAENFRSRRNVLDFTNLVFKQLMNESVGQLDYDEDAHLINGFDSFPEVANYDTEILIFENFSEEEALEDVDDDFQLDDKTEGELRIVGNKIIELIESKFPLYDKKEKRTRPIQFQDIVLLTPTKKNNLVILDIFNEMGIPLHVNDTQNYFQATEIRIMMSLLNVIDNPYQDIPLASVLRSPIVGLKENELSAIRLANPTGSFYEGVLSFIRQKPVKETAKSLVKVQRFHKQLLSWRESARRLPLVQLIWIIYNDSGFLDYVGGMPSGRQRQANLHALYERASAYEEMSFKGLFQFVRFIEKMQMKDKDLAEPTAIGAGEDAVRVMTIHASKGLEFPVVFILDLTRHFNLMDIRKPYIFDDKLGAGIRFTDTEKRLFYYTYPYLGIKEEKRKKLLAEEMRKLYVALTRAEEKLFLVGSYKSQEEMWKKWSQVALHQEVVLPDEIRLKSQTLMDWVGFTLMRHPDTQEAQTSYDTVKVPDIYTHPANFSINFSNLDALRTQSQKHKKSPLISSVIEKTNESIEMGSQKKEAIARLNYTYPYELATRTTSYQSVSEIKRVFEDPDNTELLTLDLTKEVPRVLNRFVQEKLATPKFMEHVGAVSSREVGVGTHLLMQRLSLEKVPTKESLRSLLEELVVSKSIEATVAKAIKLENILDFFATDFGQSLVTHEDVVVREQPFSMLMSAEEIFENYPLQGEDQILIHGIIDGFYETAEELVLYDFKTDKVKNSNNLEEIEKIKQNYRGQLVLYKRALEQVKRRPVTAVKLILLDAQLTLSME